MALGTFWAIDIALAAASIGFLLGLMYIYRMNFHSLRSPLSVGLIVFAGLFLVENLAAMYYYVAMNDRGWGADIAVPMLVLNAAELIGFATLFFVSWR